MQYIILAVIFISLYLSIVWLSFYLISGHSKKREFRELPLVTVCIPSYNEERGVEKTIRSVAALNYPNLEVIIVDDGSTDGTRQIIQKTLDDLNLNIFTFIKKPNGGKSTALNAALAKAKGDYFACVDSDSTVSKNSLKNIMPNFTSPEIGSVISAIKVNKPTNIYEKVQWIEYLMSIFARKLMSNVGTLVISHGVLSVYQTEILQKLGGFDEETLTEDFEIAMRLRYNGFKTVIEERAITYTDVPTNFYDVWRQRLRWFRGFIVCNWKFKKMFLNKEYTSFGLFQMPVNILGVFLLVFGISWIMINMAVSLYEFLFRSFIIDGYFLNYIFSGFSLKEFLLGQNLLLAWPLAFATVVSIMTLWFAHQFNSEKLLYYPLGLVIYIFVYPYITFIHWMGAIFYELLRFKRRW